MSDKDDISPEDRELEAELRRLSPSKMKEDFFDELIRDHERIVTSQLPAPRRSKWMVPTLAACALAFFGTTFLKIHNAAPGVNTTASRSSEPAAGEKRNDFVPVSTEGYLLNAASEGIIESESGPREQFELRYEDVQLWHNPDTETSIRIFSPRKEIITVPVVTD
ncbi:MAG: hypothetical protein P1V20_04575 [Verrucomicrobiales bacterium]|nr:hypothetical protein [Verrucomicrobiales bacterium]